MPSRRLPKTDHFSRTRIPSAAATWTPISKLSTDLPTSKATPASSLESTATPEPQAATTSSPISVPAQPRPEALKGPLTYPVMRIPHFPWLLMPDEEYPGVPVTPDRWSLISEVPMADLPRRKVDAKKDAKKVHWADESDGSDPDWEVDTWSNIERRQKTLGDGARDLGASKGSKSSTESETWEFPEPPFNYTSKDEVSKFLSGLSHRPDGISCILPGILSDEETKTIRRNSDGAPGVSENASSTLVSPSESDRSKSFERPTSTHPMTTRSGSIRGLNRPSFSGRGGCLSRPNRSRSPRRASGTQSTQEAVGGNDSPPFGDKIRNDVCRGWVANLPSSSPSPPSSPPAVFGSKTAELNFLRSNDFDPQSLRPVSDLSQIFSTMTTIFGEPGTGLLPAQFGPPKGATMKFGETMYDVNSSAKSRHIDIEMLRTKVPHRVLLSYNLDPIARRDAIEIGVRSGAGTSGAVDAIFVGPRLFDRTSTKGRVPSSSPGKRVHGGSGMFNSREGNRRRNSDPKAWIVGADGQRKRRRESDFYEEVKERDSELRKRNKVARAVEEGDLNKAVKEMKSDDVSMAQWSDLVTWRLIKLSADVEIDGEKQVGCLVVEKKKVETHISWWAVPEKVIVGGIF